MPDWLTHVLAGYAAAKIIGTKLSSVKERETAIIVLGSLLPDGVKIGYIFEFFGVYLWDFLAPLGTVTGAALSSLLLSLLFKEERKAFALLLFGSMLHIFLDLFTMHATLPPPIFFPLSWAPYEIGLFRADDCRITIAAVVLAALVYGLTNRSKTAEGKQSALLLSFIF